jgi:dihydropteroate synthase
MGVVNVTPDSFSDGGRFLSVEAAIAHALRLVNEGANILDLGAESSRPGSESISAEEEIHRLRPVLQGLAGCVTARISVDTTKAEVAAEALNLGATMVNDITAASDPDMLEVVRKHGAALVLMHMRGTPRTMQQDTTYEDVVNEVRQFLSERVAAARRAGIGEILIDPGIGFGKSVQQNVTLLQRLSEFRSVGCPILVGPSRKSFLGAISGCRDAASRVPESIGAACAAAMAGAEYVRVHDVAECRRAISIVDAVRGVQWTVS